MKRLISLISSEGKSKEQLVEKVWQSVQKFRKVEKRTREAIDGYSYSDIV